MNRNAKNNTVFQIAIIDYFGDLSLIGSGLPNPLFGPQAEDFQQYWLEQNRELVAKSTQGKIVLAEGNSH